MIINDKFKYPILERVDTDIGRHYLDSNNNMINTNIHNCSHVLRQQAFQLDGILDVLTFAFCVWCHVLFY